MANPIIKIKRSAVAGKIPTTTDLELGELAINTYDGKVYIEQDQGAVGVGTTIVVINPWSVGTGTNTYNTYFTAGSVGVGTTNPPDKLSVFGRIQIQQDSTSNNRLVFRGQPASSYRWSIDNYGSSNDFRIFREDDATALNGTTLVSISTIGTLSATKFSGDGSLLTNLPSSGGSSQWVTTSAGIHTLSYVGIGTTNPSQKFEVVGGEIKAGRVDTSSEGGQLSFGRASDNNTGWYIDVYGSTSTPDLRFIDVSNAAVRAVINGSGNFGIKNASPTSALDVSGDAKVSGIITASSFSGNATSATYATSSGIATYATTSGVSTYASSSGIATYSSTAGIATYATTAGVSTSVIGGIGSITQLQVTGVSTFTNGPVLVGSATSTGTSSQILQVTGGAYVSGSVGIGTTNPTSKLTVQGNVLVSGISTFIGDGTSTGAAIFAKRDVNNSSGIKLYGTSGGNVVYSESTFSNSKPLIIDSAQQENLVIRIAGATKATIQPTGELLIGTATSTGTASQTLQVTGGAYVSGSVGIGTTNPGKTLTVGTANGNISIGSVSTSNAIWLNNSTASTDYNILSNSLNNLNINRPSGKSIFFNQADTTTHATFDSSNNFILNSGNFAVGNFTPSYAIDAGAASLNKAGRVGGIIFGTAGTSYGVIGYNAKPSALNAWTYDVTDVASWVQFLSGGHVFYRAVSGTTGNAITPLESGRFDSSGNLLIGSSSATGTASQKLQVTGGAYVSGSVGIGTTNPTSKLDIVGDAKVSGVVTATEFDISGSSNTLTSGGLNVGFGTFSGNISVAGVTTTQHFRATGVSTVVNLNATGIITASNGIQGIGIYSGGTSITTGIITALNFVGSGNTFAVNGTTVDISISGGGSQVSVSTVAPSSPSVGSLWYNTNLGRTFVYYNDGSSSQWVDVAPFNQGGTNSTVTVSSSAPSSPVEGQLWYSTLLARTFIYYSDGSSSQWVDAAPFNTQTVNKTLTIGTRSTAGTLTLVGTGLTISLRSGVGTASF